FELDLDPDALTAVGAALEGHPDNVAPAVRGGATLAVAGPDGLVVTALAVLPASLPHATAVQAAARSAALLEGLAQAEPRLLAVGLDDVLHVPFRRALVPGYD